MNLDKLKPAWQQYKWINGQIPLSEDEVLALLTTSKGSKARSLAVNLVMLITLLLVCY